MLTDENPAAADPRRRPERTAGEPAGTGLSPLGRAAMAVSAVIAWLGVLLTAAISALGGYHAAAPAEGMYGAHHPEGLAGGVSRLLDTLSYFTIWSNIVVAVVATLLARAATRDTFALRALRLCGLVMITVTAIVYAVVLMPTATIVGWSRLTDPMLHQLTPALTVLLFLVLGPRRWISGRVLLASLVVPVAYVGYMLARGVAIEAYPYPFLNVVALGYPTALRNLGFVLLFGLALGLFFWGLDGLVARVTARRRG